MANPIIAARFALRHYEDAIQNLKRAWSLIQDEDRDGASGLIDRVEKTLSGLGRDSVVNSNLYEVTSRLDSGDKRYSFDFNSAKNIIDCLRKGEGLRKSYETLESMMLEIIDLQHYLDDYIRSNSENSKAHSV